MTDRPRILALAADYDTAPTKAAKQVRRAALLEAVKVDGLHRWVLPGHSSDNNATRVVSRWVAASRRAVKPPRPTTGKRGPIPSDRIHRLDVPATEATVQAVKAHAARTGRKAATVAGDLLEVGAKALRGDGGCDE